MIKVEKLTKNYGAFLALNEIDFEIQKGEVVGFLGPNGAGKTTTMRILTCFYPPTSGQAWVAGHSVNEAPNRVKENIGYLPETPPVYPEMTIDSYLKFVMELKRLPKKQQTESLDWALEKCGLKDRRRSLIGNLSKGYRQRVGIAQAVIHRPPVIILDEPTVGLDPIQIQEIRSLIQGFGGEHTVLLSTHILSEVNATCERAIIVHRGRIVHEQQIKELSERRGLEEVFLEVISKDSVEEESRASGLSVA